MKATDMTTMDNTDGDEIARIEPFAALEFEAYPKEITGQLDAEPWRIAGIDMRFAAAVLTKTKPELIEIVRSLGDAAMIWERRLTDVSAEMRRYAEMAHSADIRLLSALAAAVDGETAP